MNELSVTLSEAVTRALSDCGIMEGSPAWNLYHPVIVRRMSVWFDQNVLSEFETPHPPLGEEPCPHCNSTNCKEIPPMRMRCNDCGFEWDMLWDIEELEHQVTRYMDADEYAACQEASIRAQFGDDIDTSVADNAKYQHAAGYPD